MGGRRGARRRSGRGGGGAHLAVDRRRRPRPGRAVRCDVRGAHPLAGPRLVGVHEGGEGLLADAGVARQGEQDAELRPGERAARESAAVPVRGEIKIVLIYEIPSRCQCARRHERRGVRAAAAVGDGRVRDAAGAERLVLLAVERHLEGGAAAAGQRGRQRLDRVAADARRLDGAWRRAGARRHAARRRPPHRRTAVVEPPRRGPAAAQDADARAAAARALRRRDAVEA